jgi:hypothetical protein
MRQLRACASAPPFVLPFFSPEPDATTTKGNTRRLTQKLNFGGDVQPGLPVHQSRTPFPLFALAIRERAPMQ